MEEYTIKRKDKYSPFKCPECKTGDLEYRGCAGLFRFKCLNNECNDYFM